MRDESFFHYQLPIAHYPLVINKGDEYEYMEQVF